MTLTIQVGAGEFLDKYSILEIKSGKITDPEKLNNVLKEKNILTDDFNNMVHSNAVVAKLYSELLNINNLLWEVEDKLRILEKDKDFSDTFINLARLVYNYNDLRADIKKRINITAGSEIIEEKFYIKYQ